ncbi:unnamed protein product [Brugia timori]|nr:unnamed protein product [Brugia timori]
MPVRHSLRYEPYPELVPLRVRGRGREWPPQHPIYRW